MLSTVWTSNFLWIHTCSLQGRRRGNDCTSSEKSEMHKPSHIGMSHADSGGVTGFEFFVNWDMNTTHLVALILDMAGFILGWALWALALDWWCFDAVAVGVFAVMCFAFHPFHRFHLQRAETFSDGQGKMCWHGHWSWRRCHASLKEAPWSAWCSPKTRKKYWWLWSCAMSAMYCYSVLMECESLFGMFGGSRWCELGFRNFGSGAQCSTCIVWWRPCWFSVLRSYVFWILMISSHQARQKAVGELTTASPGRWTHCVLLKWPDWPDQTMIKLWSNYDQTMIKLWSNIPIYSNQVQLVELLILEPGSRKRQHVYIQGMACARMGCLYLCSSTGNQTRCLSTWRLARFKHGLPTCSHAVIVYREI